ncbi:alanine--tRNA ligase [Psychroflexus montanilacus]|uniref:alanine--tRNA ligase n=1 Tax=Psychroflexus montanilacus TaxID=2873598 RepID=UPI001CC9044E|nr:alanine--tRNA ligase [Psychroflexus montanilacus]MBZ9651372.1 alanine--tRNA ligase [Psychroflexus montanilacus]
MNSILLRRQFLEFFESKSHAKVDSAPIVLKDDPTLMFTNAGMNQFKSYFLGNSEPKSTRVTNSQKCLRVSGKHNDLEEVGKDTYHHTMFEMLGNWSFGDYFKKEAIDWAWEFLTEVLEISKENLYVTIFEGDQADGLAKDTEAYEFWKALVNEDKILLGNKKDNFWEMGDQGPCGPASEIHVDLRTEAEKKKVPGKDLVNQDHPQVVEIWNLVFIQYNRKANGSLEMLPSKHIDTGMGFERLCMVMQGKTSNYDTDVFTPLIQSIEKITGKTYGKSEEIDIAIRVIADHVRAVAFAIADGQLPSSTGAGYVIRRILRRAIRYGFTFLDVKTAFIYQLVDVLSKQMGEAFPEISNQAELCRNVIREEEKSFLKTLEQGLGLLDNLMEASSSKTISGQKAFELYDTFGFPIDLTSLILSEKGYELDFQAFQEELTKQKKRSKDAAQTSSSDWTIVIPNESGKFVGYDQTVVHTQLIQYRKVTSKKDGEQYQLVFKKTPFYPEGGGQVGDKGYLEFQDGSKVYILDTKKENNQIIHFSKTLPSSTNQEFRAVVDVTRRQKTAANHTATHLLHQALRQILGTHVEQKGSMVNSEYLRFDFSHFSKLTDEELKAVEEFVNARIQEALEFEEERQIAYDTAIEKGAIALFGEKYGDKVRMVKFGESMELCGGTHVQNTSKLWHFIIKNESSVASGIRRIEAISSEAAKAFLTKESQILTSVKSILNQPQDILKSVESLQEENLNLKKEVEQLNQLKLKQIKSELQSQLKDINGVNFVSQKVDLDAGAMKDLAFQIGGEKENVFIVLASEANGKALLACYISKSIVESEGWNAGKIIKSLGKHIQGGGGGQAFFATAGGKNASGIPSALEEARSIVEQKSTAG